MDGKDLPINGEYAKLYFKENAEKQAESKAAGNPLELFTSIYVKDLYDEVEIKKKKDNEEESLQQGVKSFSMPNPHRIRNKEAKQRKEKSNTQSFASLYHKDSPATSVEEFKRISEGLLELSNGLFTKDEIDNITLEYLNGVKPKDGKTLTDEEKQEKFKQIVLRETNKKEQEKAIKNIREDFEKTKSKQGCIGSAWDSTKNFFGMKTGSEYVESQIKALEDGKISKDEAEKTLNGYKEGQEQVVDVTADLASATVAAGCYAAALGGAVTAPFTGGASLGVTATAIAGATAAGAATKAAIKGVDAMTGGRDYSLKDGLTDAATGAINGPLAFATAGAGLVVAKAGAKVGIPAAKAALSTMENQVVVGLGKATTKTTVIETADALAKKAAEFTLEKEGVEITMTASKETMKKAATSEIRKTGEAVFRNAPRETVNKFTSVATQMTANNSATPLIDGAKIGFGQKLAFNTTKGAIDGAVYGGGIGASDYSIHSIVNGTPFSVSGLLAHTGMGAAGGLVFGGVMSAGGTAIGEGVRAISHSLPNTPRTIETPKAEVIPTETRSLIKPNEQRLLEYKPTVEIRTSNPIEPKPIVPKTSVEIKSTEVKPLIKETKPTITEVKPSVEKPIQKIRQNEIKSLLGNSTPQEVKTIVNGEEQSLILMNGRNDHNGSLYATDSSKQKLFTLTPVQVASDVKRSQLARDLYEYLGYTVDANPTLVEIPSLKSGRNPQGLMMRCEPPISVKGCAVSDKAKVNAFGIRALLGDMRQKFEIADKGNLSKPIIKIPYMQKGYTSLSGIQTYFMNGLAASKEEVIESLQRAVNIPDNVIIDTVKKYYPESNLAECLANNIIGNRDKMALFLKIFKQTEQNGLPIQKHIEDVVYKTNSAISYSAMKGKGQTEFIDAVMTKYDKSISELFKKRVQLIDTRPEIKSLLLDRLNRGELSFDEISEIPKILYHDTKPEFIDAALQLSKDADIPISTTVEVMYMATDRGKKSMELVPAIAKSMAEVKDVLGNQNYRFNTTEAHLYNHLINNGTVNQDAVNIYRILKQNGATPETVYGILDSLKRNDGSIPKETFALAQEILKKDTDPEFLRANMESTYLSNENPLAMIDYTQKLKKLGFNAGNIEYEFKNLRKLYAENPNLEKPEITDLLDFTFEIAERGNASSSETHEFLTGLIKQDKQFLSRIKNAAEKRPDLSLNDLRKIFLRATRNDADLDFTAQLLEKGVDKDGLGEIVYFSRANSGTEPGTLTPVQAEIQTKEMRDFALNMLDKNEYTPMQIASVLSYIPATADRAITDFIKSGVDKYSYSEIETMLRLSNLPMSEKSIGTVFPQRKAIIDTMEKLYEQSNNIQDVQTMVKSALSFLPSTGRVVSVNERALGYVKTFAEQGLSAKDVNAIVNKFRISSDVLHLTPEQIAEKTGLMGDFAQKLLFEKKLSTDVVTSLMNACTKKSSRGIPFDFEPKSMDVVTRFVDEGLIKSCDEANIGNVLSAVKQFNYDPATIDKFVEIMKTPVTLSNGKTYKLSNHSFLGCLLYYAKDAEGKFDLNKFLKEQDLYILNSDYGFNFTELTNMARLYSDRLAVGDLSTNVKVNLLNKLAYLPEEARKVINSNVLDKNSVPGNVDVLIDKLTRNIDLASKGTNTTQHQRETFLKSFISNAGKNPETRLTPVEERLSQYDFTQYGKSGIPLKYSRNAFIDDIRTIVKDLPAEEQARVLKFHNIDLTENGYNSNPRIRTLIPLNVNLSSKEYSEMFSKFTSMLDSLTNDNIQLQRGTSTESLIDMCRHISGLSDAQLQEIARIKPDTTFEKLTQLRKKAKDFGGILANNDSHGLPTPITIKVAKDSLAEYESFTPAMKKASEQIDGACKKFFNSNEIQTPDAEINEILNGMAKGMPDIMNMIGKPQHKTHDFSVDVHTMEVLRKALSDPEYKNLSDLDRTILKFSVLLHDIGKKFQGFDVPDTGHEVSSAEIASKILGQFKLPQNVKDRILGIIKYHNWFAEYNKSNFDMNKVAALFSSPDDYKIAKLIAKSDLSSINSDFHYKVLGINESQTPQHFDEAFETKLANVNSAFDNMYKKTNLIMNSKILNPKKIPMDTEHGVRVLNLTDESIPSDMDLGKFGMNGTTKDNLRLGVHMVDPNNLLGNLESAKLGMESTTSDNNIWSISLLKMDRTRTYFNREYGIITDTPISNIAIASPNNIGSGYEKGLDKFVSLLFSPHSTRSYLSDNFMKYLRSFGINITQDDYKALSKLIYNKQFLSQLETKPEVEINGKLFPTEAIVKAIQSSTDSLFNGRTHIEIVASKPKLQGLVAKKNSIDEVNPELITFAKKYDLPIILIGNK